MKIDVMLDAELAGAGPQARKLEALGCHGLLAAESERDPFLLLALAIQHTETIEVGSCAAVAYPRSPMHLAQVGHDLQTFSQGRFLLGLGPESGTPLESARIREVVLAMRAIWRCWNEGAALDFHGEFYTHSLMTPYFDPGPTGYGPPRVFLAAAGEAMAEVAGEVADGMFLDGLGHGDNLREVVLPALHRGLSRSGRIRSDVEVSLPVFARTGDPSELGRIRHRYGDVVDRVRLVPPVGAGPDAWADTVRAALAAGPSAGVEIAGMATGC
jgi:probable F420-dependent oxidoreductase